MDIGYIAPSYVRTFLGTPDGNDRRRAGQGDQQDKGRAKPAPRAIRAAGNALYVHPPPSP